MLYKKEGNTMSKTTKIVGIASGSFAALVGVALPLSAIAESCDTSVSATVNSTLSCSGGSVSISSITPGQAGTGTATISVTTNSPSGFNLTYSTPGNLASGSNNIAYSASAATGVQGWKAVVTGTSHTSEWSSTAIANGTKWTHSSYSSSAVTDTLTITVGTTTTTPSGTYTGSLGATCLANS